MWASGGSMARERARTDGNHTEIQRVVETVGASWQSLAAVGHGCPDALVGWRGRNHVWEIKNPDQPPSKQKLTKDEAAWHERWGGQVEVIRTREDALASLGIRGG